MCQRCFREYMEYISISWNLPLVFSVWFFPFGFYHISILQFRLRSRNSAIGVGISRKNLKIRDCHFKVITSTQNLVFKLPFPWKTRNTEFRTLRLELRLFSEFWLLPQNSNFWQSEIKVGFSRKKFKIFRLHDFRPEFRHFSQNFNFFNFSP